MYFSFCIHIYVEQSNHHYAINTTFLPFVLKCHSLSTGPYFMKQTKKKFGYMYKNLSTTKVDAIPTILTLIASGVKNWINYFIVNSFIALFYYKCNQSEEKLFLILCFLILAEYCLMTFFWFGKNSRLDLTLMQIFDHLIVKGVYRIMLSEDIFSKNKFSNKIHIATEFL